ncbi:DUF4376 domain-containing protein [Methylobacterium sp. CCH5-D2]|uniref:DUF4376 domain-containing protein n=1 Tax=Methylobacterium sp. CCH5-D2 TaxID=1768765 RepID=UPI000835007B|nr:DUF4376 domain-containing protein [Methylobacterium sp. CCH5-D2]
MPSTIDPISGAIFTPAGEPFPWEGPQTKAALAAYANAAQERAQDGGVTFQGVLVKTNEKSRGLINGAYNLSQAEPDNVLDFKAVTGWADMSAAAIQAVALAVGKWVQATFTCLRRTEAAIEAGSITTYAQIDARFAALSLSE